MIKKIIYLVESPFTKRDYDRLGLEIMIRCGFEVYVWDLTPVLHPKAHHFVKPQDSIKFNNLITFFSRKDVFDAINKLDKDVFLISFIHYNVSSFLSFTFYRAISKKNLPYSIYTLSFSIFEDKNKENILRKMLKITPVKLVNYLRNIIPKVLLVFCNLKPATLVLVGGAKSIVTGPLISTGSRILFIHSLDYDLFLKEVNASINDHKFIVFLDQNLPFNTDPIFSGTKRLTTPDEYYPSLCKYFDYVEDRFGLEVIIATHPRFHNDKSYLFRGRKVEKGNTAKLVKDSKLVITHYTTAVNLVVLYNKPVIFITTNDIENSFRQSAIDTLCRYFGKRPINIDREINIDLEQELFIDREKYDRFRNDFIKVKGSPEAPFWEVVSNEIRSLDE